MPLCSIRLREQTAINSKRSFTAEMEVVHCALRAESLNIKQVNVSPEWAKCRHSTRLEELKHVERDLKPGPHEATALRRTGTRHCVQFHLH